MLFMFPISKPQNCQLSKSTTSVPVIVLIGDLHSQG